LSIKNLLSSYLLKKKARQHPAGLKHSGVSYSDSQCIIFILPQSDKSEMQKTKLNQLASKHFRNISFLIIDQISSKVPSAGSDINPHQLDFRGNLKKTAQVDQKLSFDSDLLVNFMGEVSPVIDLFISNFDAPLKIRFDHNSKFFYNFIVPIENPDVAVRFEHFLKIYQTLKK